MKLSLREILLLRCQKASGGCWLFEGAKSGGGYGIIGHQKQRDGAHRISWRVFRGPIPSGMAVLHRCDMPACCNPDHLFLGTQSDNMRDMHRKGRAVGCRKLTRDQVISIKTRLRDGTSTIGDLAREHGLKYQSIWDISKGLNWKEVQI